MQYFGLGAETRGTATDIPGPYGIEVGNPADAPAGYEERWELNLHIVDMRGAQDKSRCDLYNLTADQGLALPLNNTSGLQCCYDEGKCRVKEVKRSHYLRYTVTYMDWDASIIPLQIYILDVTDMWTKADESRGRPATHHCLVKDIHTKPTNQ